MSQPLNQPHAQRSHKANKRKTATITNKPCLPAPHVLPEYSQHAPWFTAGKQAQSPKDAYVICPNILSSSASQPVVVTDRAEKELNAYAGWMQPSDMEIKQRDTVEEVIRYHIPNVEGWPVQIVPHGGQSTRIWTFQRHASISS